MEPPWEGTDCNSNNTTSSPPHQEVLVTKVSCIFRKLWATIILFVGLLFVRYRDLDSTDGLITSKTCKQPFYPHSCAWSEVKALLTDASSLSRASSKQSFLQSPLYFCLLQSFQRLESSAMYVTLERVPLSPPIYLQISNLKPPYYAMWSWTVQSKTAW